MADENHDREALEARSIAHAAVTAYLAGDHPKTWDLIQELLKDPMLAGLGLLALIDGVRAMTTNLALELSLDVRELWSETLRQDALLEAGRDVPQ